MVVLVVLVVMILILISLCFSLFFSSLTLSLSPSVLPFSFLQFYLWLLARLLSHPVFFSLITLTRPLSFSLAVLFSLLQSLTLSLSLFVSLPLYLSNSLFSVDCRFPVISVLGLSWFLLFARHISLVGETSRRN